MKIILLLNSDIHAAKALGLLSNELKKHEVKIILSKSVGKPRNIAPELLAMKGVETCEIDKIFSAHEFLFCVHPVVVGDRDAGKISAVYSDINCDDSVTSIKRFAPDLIISIRFGQILKQALIDSAAFGVINLHSGILPKYRGVMASFWAILRGEKKLGTTLHYIEDGGIDTGKIIGFSESEIDCNVSLVENINKLYDGGCAMILEVLKKISAGDKIKTINQKNLGDGEYFSYPNCSDVKDFLKIMPLV